MYMGDLIEQFCSHLRANSRSRRTVERRRWSLGRWQRHLERHGATFGTATIEHLEEFIVRWPAPETRRGVRGDLNKFYEWAIDRGHLDCANPTERLAPIRVPKRGATPVDIDDVRRLIATAPRPVDRLMVMLAAYAGLRTSEISAMRGEHADLDRRQLTVLGKGAKLATVPISDELAHELARWPRSGRLVPITGPSVGDRIRTMLRRLEIDARPHDLRHSFGTQAAHLNDGNMIVVARLMRHESIGTSQRYVKWGELRPDLVTGLYDERDAA